MIQAFTTAVLVSLVGSTSYAKLTDNYAKLSDASSDVTNESSVSTGVIVEEFADGTRVAKCYVDLQSRPDTAPSFSNVSAPSSEAVSLRNRLPSCDEQTEAYLATASPSMRTSVQLAAVPAVFAATAVLCIGTGTLGFANGIWAQSKISKPGELDSNDRRLLFASGALGGGGLVLLSTAGNVATGPVRVVAKVAFWCGLAGHAAAAYFH